MALRVVHWNARGLLRDSGLLRTFLADHMVDVMLISETHLKPSYRLRIPNYLVYRRDETSPHGVAYRGLAVLIKRRIVHQPLDSPTLRSMSALGVVVQVGGNELQLFAAYRPPMPRLDVTDIRALLNNNIPTIIAGDLNCKHTDWNSRLTNTAGKLLNQDSRTHDYFVSAPPSFTHIPDSPSYLPDVLDIVIYRGLNAHLSQEVIPELGSDHLPVLLTITQPATKMLPPSPRYRENWDRFATILSSKTLSYPVASPQAVDSLAEDITELIRGALDAARSPAGARRGPSPLPASIREMIREKRRTRILWMNTRCPLAKARLNALGARIRKALDDHSGDRWRAFIDGIGDEIPSVHRLCRQMTGEPPSAHPLTARDGTPRFRDADRAQIFAECLADVFRPNPDIAPAHSLEVESFVDRYLASGLSVDEDPIVFTPGMVTRALKQCNPRSAPGGDGVTNLALRWLPRRTIAMVTRLYNSILRTGHFPDCWKLGRVIMIPKPLKNVSRPESYRPITLLPTLSKVFERLVLRYLGPHLTPREEQFGFRPGHSTTLQLTRVLHDMKVASERKEYTVAVMLDMEKAFDRVWHRGLVFKVARSTAPRRLVRIISSFLEGRRFQVAVGGALSAEYPVLAGVPQGSCLSPVLYSCFTDDIPVGVGVRLALYADDAAYFATSMGAKHAALKMQRNLYLLPEWLAKWRLSVNVGKTQALITGCRIPPRPLDFDGHPIEWSPQVKYLGVTIDGNLTMAHHVTSIVGRVKGARRLLYPVFRSGLSLQTKRMIYITYIRSRLTYAAPAWYALVSNTNRAKMRAQQALTLRTIADAPRYMRTENLLRDLRIETLDAYVARLAANMFRRADACEHPHVRNIAPLHTRPPDASRKYARLLASEAAPLPLAPP